MGKNHWKSWAKLTNHKGQGGMGFKDLIDFNTALLTKMVWRLLNKLEVLWARILKGLYFPHDELFKARKGARASWCWSSLWEAKDVVQKGAIWQVQDGRIADIWDDAQVPSYKDGRLHVIEGSEVPFTRKVEKLIDRRRLEWKVEELGGCVSDNEINAIRQIPILPGE